MDGCVAVAEAEAEAVAVAEINPSTINPSTIKPSNWLGTTFSRIFGTDKKPDKLVTNKNKIPWPRPYPTPHVIHLTWGAG